MSSETVLTNLASPALPLWDRHGNGLLGKSFAYKATELLFYPSQGPRRSLSSTTHCLAPALVHALPQPLRKRGLQRCELICWTRLTATGSPEHRWLRRVMEPRAQVLYPAPPQPEGSPRVLKAEQKATR